jgi:hypothetical protein
MGNIIVIASQRLQPLPVFTEATATTSICRSSQMVDALHYLSLRTQCRPLPSGELAPLNRETHS